MLPGLTALELGRLRMSVGYGGHKKGRPLSPVEVGLLLRKAQRHGASVAECAEAARLHGTGILRFLRILELPPDLRHLIDWGSGKNFVGFSAAVETTKLMNPEDQRALVAAILASNLNSKEVGQVSQLRHRSGRSIGECVREILQMRPKVLKRYVFIGSVGAENVEAMREITQSARDLMLAAGLERVGIKGATGRLGVRFFTLVGDERFNSSMREVGKDKIEAQLRSHISQSVTDATHAR